MANSNIKLFDENKANMLGDEAYNTNTQRLGGVQAGVASSQLQNKFQYQMSLVAYAIAQMMIANNLNAMDSDAVTTFISNLSNTVLQKVIDKASTADAISGTDDTKWMTPALVKAYVTNWASSGTITWKNLVVNGTLRVTGATTLQSSLTVSGKTTINGAAEFGSTVLLGRDPTANLQAATKAYVDKGVSGVTSKVNGLYKMLKSKSYNSTLPTSNSYTTLVSFESGINLTNVIAFLVKVKGTFTISTPNVSTQYYIALGENFYLASINFNFNKSAPINIPFNTCSNLPFSYDSFTYDKASDSYSPDINILIDENSYFTVSCNTNKVTTRNIDIKGRSPGGNGYTISFNGKFELWGVYLP